MRISRAPFARFLFACQERGADLPREVHRQLVSALRDGDFGPRSEARRGSGEVVGDSLSGCRNNAGTNEFITVATTRTETMLGDTAIAVNAKDERYRHLHGKSVMLPLMNRDSHHHRRTGAARIRHRRGVRAPRRVHDPNDFQAGLRHNLTQIDIMDEHAHMNENAGPYAGLDRCTPRERVLEALRAQPEGRAARPGRSNRCACPSAGPRRR